MVAKTLLFEECRLSIKLTKKKQNKLGLLLLLLLLLLYMPLKHICNINV